MNKEHFLISLKISLRGIPAPILEDTLAYYEAAFEKEIEAGKSEELISKELGNPKDIAKGVFVANNIQPTVQAPQFSKGDWVEFDAPRKEQKYAEAHHEYTTTRGNFSPIRNLFVAIALGFFNFIFLLAPIIAIGGILFAGWVTSICFILSPIIGIIIAVAALSPYAMFQLFGSMILCGLGLLLLLIMIPVTKFFFKAFLVYTKWNIRVIRGGY